MKKLVLIDGMALVYRAYYALNRVPRLNSKGLNTSAILGFATTLYDMLHQQNPTHIAVAFDLPKPTFRHELYPQYKANRDAMPEAICDALPYIKKLIAAFNIPILTCEGYEADDVIGTISFQAQQHGFDDILMVTPDKDFAQLVTDHIRMYRFGRAGNPDEILGVQEVLKKYGIVDCRQVIDLLGLWGDASDNIPGIAGVGEKTAKKLIAQFGSVEAMIDNVDEIPNQKLRELVKTSAEQALFSKKLATIALDAPIPFDENQLLRVKPDYAALSQLFDELEFRAFAKRIYTELSVSDPSEALLFSRSKTVANKEDGQGLQLSLFAQPDAVKEHTDAAFAENEVATVALAQMPVDGDVAVLVDGDQLLLSTDSTSYFQSALSAVNVEDLRRLLGSENGVKICYNLKELKYRLSEYDVDIMGNIFDVQLVHYLVDSESRHSLDFIYSAVLDIEPSTAPQNVCSLWSLYPRLASQLSDASLSEIYYNVELPLVDVLISMEREGVRIDVDAIRSYSAELTKQRDDIEQQIFLLANKKFNVSSSLQLGEVLYDELKITDKPPLTATKKYSTAEDVLSKLKDKHPIVPLILEYRSISKLISTYLDSFPRLVNPRTGRLHTIYNQAVTATGRLSSSSPNLQNIPIRTERGREIRKAFVPRGDDYILLAADYSQIELRIIASLSADKHLVEAFQNGYDIHSATAARIYGVDIDAVTKDQRRRAKSVNFGIVYGISAFGLSEQLEIPRKEASSLIDDYFAKYPDIKSFIEQNIAFVRENGYAKTMLGRRRYLPDINSRNANLRSFAERNAVNMPVQGSSADMIKIAMNNIHAEFLKHSLKSRMILQVHDELVFDVYKPELEQVRDVVRTQMLAALPLNVPIEIGLETGDNWLDAH